VNRSTFDVDGTPPDDHESEQTPSAGSIGAPAILVAFIAARSSLSTSNRDSAQQSALVLGRFEFRCDNGEPLRVTFALDCRDREATSWAATTAGHSGDIVRDVMLAAVESRFGNELHTPSEIEWLSDNSSGYTADDTRRFAVAIGLKPLTTPVCSPQSNGMAESFVKTMKRDYVAFMPKPDAATAARNLAIAFEHYNEKHPHSALEYRSPREFRRSMDSATLV
jgi:putative transposase